MSFFSKRTAIIGGLTALAVAATGLVVSQTYARDIEIPDYEVLSTHDGFEVRHYAPRLVAEVEVEGSERDATNTGFRVLANYIFGNNTTQGEIAMTAPVDRRAASETIEMTAPVDRRAAGEERWIITFTMPSKYTMETLPRPNDDRVEIRELPPTRYAVMRFSGSPSEKKVERRMEWLAAAVQSAGLPSAGKPPVYARYDPPWRLPFLRRNEISIELAPADDHDTEP